ncbi:MAG TPA: CYCXC family (seleno)protein [Pyrinomonadaceae bacterium]|nr:CYCXC family (seleno)protein [Pyrinomonadaceae bacterium]
MKKPIGLVILILGLSLIVVALIRSQRSTQNSAVSESAVPQPTGHESHTRRPARIPAYQSTAVAADLGPTLSPEPFIGKTRDAYKVAKKIPATLAQLPCYCECDRGFGHKSLHSCFEDQHASHCAVCVDEALLAYQLQTQEKMTPEQVRQHIIEKYSTGN